MINFTGLLKVNHGANATYINTKNIEEIKGNDRKATIAYTSGLVDTFECSAHQIAKEVAQAERTEIRDVLELSNSPFTV
ncbi:MAG: hypothetical protein IJW73_09740 [Candidatus Gastranaerophilales bacterium]|nr:hypothetical protein [Candidatus Gastranaerophilales bacterium]